MKLLGWAALAASVVVAQSASAATVIGIVPGGASTLAALTLNGTEDLRNNAAPFANGGPLLRPPFNAYIFDEGTDGTGVQSQLLHYDRNLGLLSVGRVFGSFIFQLGANEVYLGAVDKAIGLLATDPLNGVAYQRSFANVAQTTATLLRGTESPDVYSTSFNAGLNQLTVSYDFINDGAAQDEVRFFFASLAVPEPTTWALMIGGFGLAGAALRRRRALAAL